MSWGSTPCTTGSCGRDNNTPRQETPISCCECMLARCTIEQHIIFRLSRPVHALVSPGALRPLQKAQRSSHYISATSSRSVPLEKRATFFAWIIFENRWARTSCVRLELINLVEACFAAYACCFARAGSQALLSCFWGATTAQEF